MSWVAVAMGTVTAATAVATSVRKKNLAKKQEARSQDLRTQGLGVKKPALRPEFQKALTGSKLQTLTGLPSEQMIKDEVDLETATNIGRGQGVASSGGELLQYAASLGAQGNQLKRGLSVESANKRNVNYGNYLNRLWNVGGQELTNEDIKRMERDKFLSQSAALENAATANKFEAGNEMIQGIGAGAATAAGGIAGGMAGKTGGGSTTQPSIYKSSGQIQQAPIGGMKSVTDSRSLLAASSPLANLLPYEKAEIQKMLADNPDMDVEEAVQLYRNLRKGL